MALTTYSEKGSIDTKFSKIEWKAERLQDRVLIEQFEELIKQRGVEEATRLLEIINEGE